MNRKPIIILSLTSLLLSAAASAQPAQQSDSTALPLTLSECLSRGFEHNYSIRIVRNNTIQAANNATRANAGALPVLSAEASYSGSLYDQNYTYPDNGTRKVDNSFNSNLFAGLAVDWTLFNGFAVQAAYDRLTELKAIGELESRIAIEDFAASLAAEYYNMIRQQIRLRNLQMSVNLSQDRLRIVGASFQVGSSSGLDYQQAEVDYNADFSSLIAQREVVRKSQIALNQMMAVDDVEQSIAIADTVIMPRIDLDRQAIWQSVESSNAALQMVGKEKRLTEIAYRTVCSRSYPYLRVSGGYGLTHYRYDPANSTYSRQQRLGTTFGVSAGMTLFDGMNRQRERRNAQLEIESSELRAEQAKLEIKSQMASLWLAYTNNVELLGIEQANLTVARSNFEIAMERYRLHELSGIELREAQLSLLQSEERLSTAEYNIKLCEISLVQLSGQILDYLIERSDD